MTEKNDKKAKKLTTTTTTTKEKKRRCYLKEMEWVIGEDEPTRKKLFATSCRRGLNSAFPECFVKITMAMLMSAVFLKLTGMEVKYKITIYIKILK